LYSYVLLQEKQLAFTLHFAAPAYLIFLIYFVDF